MEYFNLKSQFLLYFTKMISSVGKKIIMANAKKHGLFGGL